MKEYKDCNGKIVKLGDRLKVESINVGDCIMDLDLDSSEEVIRVYLDVDEFPEYVIAHLFPDAIFSDLKIEVIDDSI
jgi:hypothetical protein